MSENLELMKSEAGPVAVNTENPLAMVAGMLDTVIKGGITEQSVGAVDKLVGLLERLQDKRAEQLFNEAFVRLQQEMPKIQANRPVMNSEMKGGGLRYMFAPFEDIMKEVHPHLIRNGFTISFSQRYDGTRIISKCILRHTAGHHTENETGVRIGKGPPGSSETQADGAASTYAKRFALCDALNIVIGKDTDGGGGQDDDAGVEGTNITAQQAEDLKKRVKDTGANEIKFLEMATGTAPKPEDTREKLDEMYHKIPKSMYAEMDGLLKRKESKKK